MPTTDLRYGLKACPPLEEWRPDVPGLWPHCVHCKRPIRKGDPYAVSLVGNAVLCKPCSGQFRVTR